MERRYRDQSSQPPILTPCRHCATAQALHPDRVDLYEGRAWYRCDSCEEWFLIRWDDAVALGVAQPVATEPPTA